MAKKLRLIIRIFEYIGQSNIHSNIFSFTNIFDIRIRSIFNFRIYLIFVYVQKKIFVTTLMHMLDYDLLILPENQHQTDILPQKRDKLRCPDVSMTTSLVLSHHSSTPSSSCSESLSSSVASSPGPVDSGTVHSCLCICFWKIHGVFTGVTREY